MRTDSDLSAVRWHAGALNNGLVFGATYHLCTHLPRPCAYAIGHAGTWLAYQLMRDGSRAIVDNLRVVRPDATERELKRLALLTYRCYARDTIDFIRSLGMNRAELEPMVEERFAHVPPFRPEPDAASVEAAIKILQDNARAAGRTLHVSLTIPMTTVGLPGTGTDEIRQAIAAGAAFDIINIMAFDYGLTNASNMTDSVKLVATAAKNQMKTLFGYDDATAYTHLGLQLMNGHTDQPSELFLQADFTNLLAYARTNHFGWLSYWSLNRDRVCDPSVPHAWADGACSSVSQNAWDFTKIVAQYNG